MYATFRLMTVCAVLGFPMMAGAQDQAASDDGAEATVTEAPATEAPAADENETPGMGLDMGTPDDAGGAPQVGETYVAGDHGDWKLRCVKSAEGKDPCQLYQLLRDANDSPVAEFTVFNLPEGQKAAAGATIVTPLETLLTADLRLAVDGGQARRYPYSFCNQMGCFARVGFTQDEVNAFRAGNSATVTIVPAAAPNEVVALNVSLSGFTAGWNAMVEANSQ